MTALVTGVSGFIGSHLARHLVARGTPVHGLCRASSDLTRVADTPIELHLVDLRDADAIHDVVRRVRPTEVFHLAGAPIIGGETSGAVPAIETNIVGTMTLIEACIAASVCSLVLTGDAFEYGPSVHRRRESDACRPDDVHGLTKLTATRYGQTMSRASDVAIATVRLFSVYGPGDHPRRLVPRLLDAAVRDAVVSLSDPEIVRDWVHVDDVVQLFTRVAAEPAMCTGRVLNAGSGEATTIAALVRAVEAVSGRDLDVRWGDHPTAEHDLGWWVADPTHTEQLVGWRATTSLADGLAALWAGAEATT